MALQKHEREIIKAVKDLHPLIEVDYVESGAHPKLRATCQGKTVTVPVSRSPRSDSTSNVRMVCQNVRRGLLAEGVDITKLEVPSKAPPAPPPAPRIPATPIPHNPVLVEAMQRALAKKEEPPPPPEPPVIDDEAPPAAPEAQPKPGEAPALQTLAAPLNEWDKGSPEALVSPNGHKPHLFQVTKNTNRETFYAVRDNPGLTYSQLVSLLADKGHNPESVGAILSMMSRDGLIERRGPRGSGTYYPAAQEYRSMRSGATIARQRAKERESSPLREQRLAALEKGRQALAEKRRLAKDQAAKRGEMAEKVRAARTSLADKRVAMGLPPKAPPAPPQVGDVYTGRYSDEEIIAIIEALPLKQARKVFDKLKELFG